MCTDSLVANSFIVIMKQKLSRKLKVLSEKKFLIGNNQKHEPSQYVVWLQMKKITQKLCHPLVNMLGLVMIL